MTTTAVEASWVVLNMWPNMKNSSFYSHRFWERLNTYGYDVHEGLYHNCKIHSLWTWGSGPRAVPILPCSGKLFNLKKSFLLPNIWEKIIVWLWCWWSHLLHSEMYKMYSIFLCTFTVVWDKQSVLFKSTMSS